jgi:hypothetical protein
MSTVTIDKAFLRYYDEHGFGNKSAEEVRVAKQAFVAGYEAAHGAQRTCANCGGPVNASSGYLICENGCGGPVVSR